MQLMLDKNNTEKLDDSRSMQIKIQQGINLFLLNTLK